MYRWIVFTFFLQFAPSFTFGQVLFQESFSPQTAIAPQARAKLVEGSLDYKFHSETGGRLSVKDDSAGTIYDLRSLQVDPAQYKTLYMAFCLRSLNTSTKDKFGGLVLYNDDKEVFGLGNDYTSEIFSFWTSNGLGLPIGEIPTAVDNDVHRIVMRIDFHADGPETIKIGLDPFCQRTEDRQPHHIWTNYECELTFDELRLRCGNTDSAWEFDELLIGADWQSVNPADGEPGTYIENMTAAPLAAGKTEMIGEGIARFWPDGVDTEEDVLPSLALEKPVKAIGPLAEKWAIRPAFGTSGGKKYAYVEMDPEIDLYGTGEVTGSLLRNGRKIVLFNKDNYGYGKPDQLYQSHPWVLGIRPDGTAFGILFDTCWKAELDLRSGVLFTIPEAAPFFPVIVIDGQNPQQVMIRLAALTGKMPMPPRWALGYHQCRYSYNPDARVRQIVDTFRAKRIPCDVIWFDIDYMNGFRIFTFDPNQFPDPKATNDYLHSMGFKSVWMIDPGVKHDPKYFVYQSGDRADAWVKDALGKPFIGPVWPGDCVFPDFTVPAVRRWWAQLYGAFMAMGIDGVWNDMNEPAVFNDQTGGTMPPSCQHRGGGGLPAGPHEQYHNVYGMLMVKASREGIQEANPDKRPFVLSRANFLGGHRYAATWTGDNKSTWEHLKWSIPMSLNLSLSGQPFNGPDIGGFIDNATPQLWAHWIAAGAFYPFSRAHTCKDTVDHEPWSFGPETENAARVALQRRYRLMPYLYTVFKESHQSGLPVMRPVFFADPANISLRMEDQAFLLGSDLMVIPRWATSVQQPKGIWREVSITSDDGQDVYQCILKARGGAIIPLGPVVQSTEEIADCQPLTLLIALDKNGAAQGSLYEDNGDGYDELKGEFCLSSFTAQKQAGRVLVQCTQQEGNWKSPKRLVNVVLVEGDNTYYGFGDICGGVSVIVDNASTPPAKVAVNQ